MHTVWVVDSSVPVTRKKQPKEIKKYIIKEQHNIILSKNSKNFFVFIKNVSFCL